VAKWITEGQKKPFDHIPASRTHPKKKKNRWLSHTQNQQKNKAKQKASL
jgi:hypothetical protein